MNIKKMIISSIIVLICLNTTTIYAKNKIINCNEVPDNNYYYSGAYIEIETAVNTRYGPSTEYQRASVEYPGTRFMVLDINNGYCNYPTPYGYVYFPSKYCRVLQYGEKYKK